MNRQVSCYQSCLSPLCLLTRLTPSGTLVSWEKRMNGNKLCHVDGKTRPLEVTAVFWQSLKIPKGNILMTVSHWRDVVKGPICKRNSQLVKNWHSGMAADLMYNPQPSASVWQVGNETQKSTFLQVAPLMWSRLGAGSSLVLPEGTFRVQLLQPW